MTNQDTTNDLIHDDNTLTKDENLNVSNAKSIDEIAKILHETIEIEVWPEEGDYNLDDQSVKAAAEILANKYVAKSVEDKTITAITSKYFMATDPERLALADDIQALISNQDTTSIDDEIDNIIVRHNQYIDAVWQGKHQMYALPETHQQIKALISDQVAKARIETIDYYSWRFECNTGVSEMYGWRNTLERAKDQTLRHFEVALNGVKK